MNMTTKEPKHVYVNNRSQYFTAMIVSVWLCILCVAIQTSREISAVQFSQARNDVETDIRVFTGKYPLRLKSKR